MNFPKLNSAPLNRLTALGRKGEQWRRIVDETMTRHASADVTGLSSARARDHGTHDESKTINFSRQQKPTALRAVALRQLRLLKLDHSTRRGAGAADAGDRASRGGATHEPLRDGANPRRQRSKPRDARIAQEARARAIVQHRRECDRLDTRVRACVLRARQVRCARCHAMLAIDVD